MIELGFLVGVVGRRAGGGRIGVFAISILLPSFLLRLSLIECAVSVGGLDTKRIYDRDFCVLEFVLVGLISEVRYR